MDKRTHWETLIKSCLNDGGAFGIEFSTWGAFNTFLGDDEIVIRCGKDLTVDTTFVTSRVSYNAAKEIHKFNVANPTSLLFGVNEVFVLQDVSIDNAMELRALALADLQENDPGCYRHFFGETPFKHMTLLEYFKIFKQDELYAIDYKLDKETKGYREVQTADQFEGAVVVLDAPSKTVYITFNKENKTINLISSGEMQFVSLL
jgi:hypothetical protein